MKLYMSDLYRVDIHAPLSEVGIDTLYYLYQPLISHQAISLYMMLYTEGKRMSRLIQPSPFSRLTSFLSLSLIDIEKSLASLEAIGLLKTYVKHDEYTQYVFQLQSPLTLKVFFKNQILSSLLQEALSKEDFQRTVQYFQVSSEDLSQYEEVTAQFQDVFSIQPKKPGRLLKLKNIKEEKYQNVDMDYDMNFLYQCLSDYQINKSKITEEDITYVTQLANVYHIDALTLAGMIKDAMESKGLNRKLLKSKIKAYYELDQFSSLKAVFHKQPVQYLTQDQKRTPLILHMQYLDKITPYELLKEKQGGSEPIFHDLKIVETLMVQLGLKPSVVNVLIEYVLGTNQQKLSKNYCETIGASLARKHIETAMDAYYELKNISKDDAKDVQEVQKEDNDDMEIDEIERLLSELKEGS